MTRLERLDPGQPIPWGGDRVTYVDADLAARFRPGDHLVVVQTTGDLLHIPAAEHSVAANAVTEAEAAFAALAACDREQVTGFFELCAQRLEDAGIGAEIRRANESDVAAARARQRATHRLELSSAMLAGMVEGLRMWAATPGLGTEALASHRHDGWRVEEFRAPVGVIGFVFEGRPNVVVDALGVLRTGNTAVMRIGSDALGTARAIAARVIAPSLADAGLPDGSIGLVESTAHAAGWALVGDRRLALAVARGSGRAVAQLGAVARQAGVPVSLHGTGGAWIVVDETFDPDRLRRSVMNSLDRKVCNTVNVICVPRSVAIESIDAVITGLRAAAARRQTTGLVHLDRASAAALEALGADRPIVALAAEGDAGVPTVLPLERAELGVEWEWEERPEITLVVVDDVAEAVALFNAYSPRFIATLISTDDRHHEWFESVVEAPFVGDGFTRWVDGQYALSSPELGLSNWEGGRLLGRSAILSGSSVFTVRLRARIDDPDLSR